MKLFCEGCKKIFQESEQIVKEGKFICPDCAYEYSVPENENVFSGRVIGDFLVVSSSCA